MAAELGINDLGDIISKLEKIDFPEGKWYDLGLKLHISQPKLDTIKANNPLDAKACLRECLALWLRWTYDHGTYGKPTLELLASAVEQMGYEDLASKISGSTNGTTQGKTGPGPAAGASGGAHVTVTADTVDRVKKELDNVLRENQVTLNDIFTEPAETLKDIARELHAANIIGKAIQKNPAYDAMIGSFVGGMKLKEDISDIEEHCVKFLKALSNVGGPVADAGDMIKKKWKKAVKDKCGLELKI